MLTLNSTVGCVKRDKSHNYSYLNCYSYRNYFQAELHLLLVATGNWLPQSTEARSQVSTPINPKLFCYFGTAPWQLGRLYSN